MRATTGSQCNLMKRGVNCALSGSLKTTLAATFWTICRGFKHCNKGFYCSYFHMIVQVPLFIPVVFCLTCFFMVFLSLYSDPLNTGIGFAISLTGIPAYFIFIYLNHRPAWLQRSFDSFNRALQIVLEVVPAD